VCTKGSGGRCAGRKTGSAVAKQCTAKRNLASKALDSACASACASCSWCAAEAHVGAQQMRGMPLKKHDQQFRDAKDSQTG